MLWNHVVEQKVEENWRGNTKHKDSEPTEDKKASITTNDICIRVTGDSDENDN